MTKNVSAQQIRLNLVDLIQQSSDPSSGGGVAAAIGSFYLRDGTGQAWLKTAAADTGWQKLVQSFNWYSVKDYGATGDNATDDTAAIQAAIDACAAAGGGVTFVPPGTYRFTQLTLKTNVQLVGSGASSVLRWTFNAGTAAGSGLNIINCSHVAVRLIQFSGAGLTNPAASRANHLIALGDGANAVTECHIQNCIFTGMTASSGDGVHVLGAAGQLVSRFWVADNNFDGCSRFGVGIDVGSQYGFIVENYMTNCETEIGLVATSSLANTGIIFAGNHIVHTSASVRHAIRIEGDATTVSEEITISDNIVLGGFVTYSNVLRLVDTENIQTSGAFASADAAKRIFGNVTNVNSTNNLIDRDPAATAGPCMSFELSGGNAPTLSLANNNILINEVSGGNLIKIVDCTKLLIGNNIGKISTAGATNYAIDVQAVTATVTDILIGTGNQITCASGSLAAAVRLLVNGASITDVSVTANQVDNINYGLRLEDAGAGSFNGQLLYAGNNADGAVGDVDRSGGSALTVALRIGFNAGTLGAQLFSGTGTPESAITARIGSIFLRTDGGQATTVYYKESGTGNTGWLGIGGQPLVFAAGDTTTSNAARYMGPGYITTANATEIKIAVTRPGTIRNLRVFAGVAGTDTQVVTFTVRKNGADTTLTTTLSNDASGAASDTTHSFTVAAGDQISISIVKAAAVTAGQQQVTAAVELV